MRSLRSIRVVLLVGLVGLTACVAPPPREPTASPTPQALLATESTVAAMAASPTADLRIPLTPTPGPPPLAPTLTPAPPPTLELPPTPAVPLEQRLPQVGPDALLYTREQELMLLDLDRPQEPLWLTVGRCHEQPPASVYGRWSADGQFIAFICQHGWAGAELYLLSMQTGAIQQIGAASILDLAWSPMGSYLLVTEATLTQEAEPSIRAYVLDATSGARVDLPAGPTFQMTGYAGLGPWRQHLGGFLALMAWAPDGAHLAIVAKDAVWVADPDGRNARTFPEANDPERYDQEEWVDGGEFWRGPLWSLDSQALLVERLVRNPHAPTPTSSVGSHKVLITLATGEVRDVSAIPFPTHEPDYFGLPAKRSIDPRSPDGRYRATWANQEGVLFLIIEAAQRGTVGELAGFTTFLGWRPAP